MAATASGGSPSDFSQSGSAVTALDVTHHVLDPRVVLEPVHGEILAVAVHLAGAGIGQLGGLATGGGDPLAVDEVGDLDAHRSSCEWHWGALGGTSSPGLRSKKPTGLSQKETVSTDITGHSSGRVTWWMPNTYQSTMSVFSMERSCAVHTGSPRSWSLWTTNSPQGQRSSGWNGVTQSVW